MISSFSAYRQLCPPGCTSCSAINGCITCQPNLFLFLARSGMRQQGICTHSCPTGYYGVRRHNYSICYSESIPFNGNSLPVSQTLQNWSRVSTIVHIYIHFLPLSLSMITLPIDFVMYDPVHFINDFFNIKSYKC